MNPQRVLAAASKSSQSAFFAKPGSTNASEASGDSDAERHGGRGLCDGMTPLNADRRMQLSAAVNRI